MSAQETTAHPIKGVKSMFTNEERQAICDAVDEALKRHDGVLNRACKDVCSNPPVKINVGKLHISTVRSIYNKKYEIALACLTNRKGVRIREMSGSPRNRVMKPARENSYKLNEKWTSLQLEQQYEDKCMFLGIKLSIFHKMKIEECQQRESCQWRQDQRADDTITIFLCTNMTGTKKRCAIAGNFVKPEGTVNYYSEPSSRITPQILQSELENWDSQLQNKIVLFTDEPIPSLELRNIKIITMDSTVKHRRIDMSQHFKCLFRAQVSSSSDTGSADWVKNVNDAWNNVSAESIKSSFVQAEVKASDGFSESWSTEDWAIETAVQEASRKPLQGGLNAHEFLDSIIRAACKDAFKWKNFIEFDDDLGTSPDFVDPLVACLTT